MDGSSAKNGYNAAEAQDAMGEPITIIRMYNIDKKIDLAPVVKELNQYFQRHAQCNNSGREVRISVEEKLFTPNFNDQRLVVEFSKPIELHSAYAPVAYSLARAIEPKNDGSSGVIKRHNITPIAVRAPIVTPA